MPTIKVYAFRSIGDRQSGKRKLADYLGKATTIEELEEVRRKKGKKGYGFIAFFTASGIGLSDLEDARNHLQPTLLYRGIFPQRPDDKTKD